MSGQEPPSDSQEISSVEFLRDRVTYFQRVGSDARSLLRINLLILGLFLPIVGSLLSGELSPSRIFNNVYTQVGLVVWGISTFLLSVTYYQARVVASSHLNPIESNILGNVSNNERPYHIQDTIAEHSDWVENINLLVTGCTLLTLLATTLFSLGVLLPYVSVAPQTIAIRIIVAAVSLAVVSYGILRVVKSRTDARSTREQGDLTRPRQELLKIIYVTVGDEAFTVSDLENRVIDQSHVLLQGISATGVSKYVLEQLVRIGYFQKVGESGETTISPPHTFEEVPVSEIEPEIEEAIDRLAQVLENTDDAQEVAANELNTRAVDVLEDINRGDVLDRIQCYNRVVNALQDGEVEHPLRPFDFASEEVKYVPTELAQDAYEDLELEKETREHKREMAEREEQIRRAENTNRYMVIEPVNEFGNLYVATHDISVPNDQYESLNIEEADISQEDREHLEQLDVDDTVYLRIQHHPQTSETYIASVGRP